MSSLASSLSSTAIGEILDVYLRPVRKIAGIESGIVIQADVTIQEEHEDEMQITDHPVARGSVISDHAFMLPRRLTLTYGFSNSSVTNTTYNFANPTSYIDSDYLKTTYSKLVTLMKSRELLSVYTGKRIYSSDNKNDQMTMLIQTLSVVTDKETENVLIITIGLREVILVDTQTATVPVNSATMSAPQDNGSVQNTGQKTLQSAPSYNSSQTVVTGGSQ